MEKKEIIRLYRSFPFCVHGTIYNKAIKKRIKIKYSLSNMQKKKQGGLSPIQDLHNLTKIILPIEDKLIYL